MNIFKLDNDIQLSAQAHHDSHCVKMMTEYTQLLCTAHRILDGIEYIDKTKSNRKIKRWKHPNPILEAGCYLASHINHPSAIWTRESDQNYLWLVSLLQGLCKEYTHRYGKIGKIERELLPLLLSPPKNIKKTISCSVLPCAMPDDCKISIDPVVNYRYYYNTRKQYKVNGKPNKYTKREIPLWLEWK